jgi:hypothetical protein
VEHLNAALVTFGNVDSGSAATTCVGVGGGGGDISRRQVTALQLVEHMDAALVTVGSVESGSAAIACVGVGGLDGGVSRLQVDRLSPRVLLSVKAAVVSVDGRWRELLFAEHLDAAVVSVGSVDSGSAAHVDGCRWIRWWCHSTAGVDSGSAVTTCVGIGGGGDATSRRQVGRLSPRVLVSVAATVVSVDGNGESCSLQSSCS